MLKPKKTKLVRKVFKLEDLFVEGKSEPAPMFSDEAAIKRGIVGCDFASNLKANVLYCQKGQLILQRALDLPVIIQYELPTQIKEL